MKKPNFFIIGAPKCGTTALHSYLGQHPNIFMSRVKEPHYFCKDLPTERRYTHRDKYLELFSDADANHIAVGESSSRYLYSQDAVQNILDFNPDAKLIVMLRNPVDLVPSFHSQLLYDFKEDESDFELAWGLQSQRAAGRQIPRRCPCPGDLQYGELAKLGQQVERLLQHAPRENVLFVLFDDFKVSPGDVYESVLRFLGVSHEFQPSFERINASKVWKSPALARILGNPPFPLNRIKAGLKNSLGLMETSIATKIYARMTVPKQRPQLTKNLHDELVEFFRDDVEHLAGMLSRDLSHWLTPISGNLPTKKSLAACTP